MTYKILFLLGMIFCHIIDDYYLQGWLAFAKQKEWWTKNTPNPLYKYDYNLIGKWMKVTSIEKQFKVMKRGFSREMSR